MEMSIITHWGGKRLPKAVWIYWGRSRFYSISVLDRIKRGVSNFYFKRCWWLYDHSNLFSPILEGERFSWRNLKGVNRNGYLF